MGRARNKVNRLLGRKGTHEGAQSDLTDGLSFLMLDLTRVMLLGQRKVDEK